MKKIFVALVLALALCLSLVGCGKEKSGADYVVEAFENIAEELETTGTMEEIRIKLSVDDIAPLYALLGATDDSMPAITDIYYDINGSEGLAAQTLSVTLDGDPISLTIFNDVEKFIFSSPQLSKSYSCTLAEYFTLLETLSGEELPYSYEDWLALCDPAFYEELSTRYGEKIEAVIRENIEFTTEKDGKNVLVSFKLMPENLTEIVYQIVTYFQADTELLDAIGKIYGEEVITQIHALVMDKEDMVAQLTDVGFAGDIALTITQKDSKIVAADVNLIAEEEPLTMQYAENETGFTANVKVEDSGIEILSKSGDGTYAFSIKGTEAGEDIVDIALQVAEDIDLSITAENTTVTISADYTKTKTGFEATLAEIKVAGIGLDLRDIGLKLLVDSKAEMPALPDEHTSIGSYTEQDLTAIVNEFVANSGLDKYMQ